MTLHLADLDRRAAAALLDGPAIPVLLLPVGAVEPHGPHAPLGTDTMISTGMCERAAEALRDDPHVRALVMPPLHYGVTRYAARFTGAVGIGERTLFDLVVDLAGSAIDQGFRHLVVVNNHFEPEHVATLRRAVGALSDRRGGKVGYLDLLRRRNAARLGAEFVSGSCHAGRYETSLVLADRPENVDRAAMRVLPALPVDMPAEIAAGRSDFLAMGMAEAYCGAPAEATPEEGEELFATLTAMLLDTIRDLVRD